jgi:hypothetical protein
VCYVAIVRRKALFVLCFNHLRAHQLSRSTLHRRTIRTIASAIAAIEKKTKERQIVNENKINESLQVGLSRISLISAKA